MNRRYPLGKAAHYAILLNVLQAAAILFLLAMVAFGTQYLSASLALPLVVAASIITLAGAVVDIREAFSISRTEHRLDTLDATLQNMEQLNRALRAQRHDFLNHLQVVYSLIEMREYKDANDYIERVYGDIQALSESIRTALPAVNALLRVKMAALRRDGIDTTLEVSANWANLPMPAWEMCGVLSNLMDNAHEALAGQAVKRIRMVLWQSVHGFHFSVEDNGPGIPQDQLKAVFISGFSSKGQGRGMGLFIARSTLSAYGGTLSVQSQPGKTVFSGFVPKDNAQAAGNAPAATA